MQLRYAEHTVVEDDVYIQMDVKRVAKVILRYVNHTAAVGDASIIGAVPSTLSKKECVRAMVLQRDCGNDLAWSAFVTIWIL